LPYARTLYAQGVPSRPQIATQLQAQTTHDH